MFALSLHHRISMPLLFQAQEDFETQTYNYIKKIYKEEGFRTIRTIISKKILYFLIFSRKRVEKVLGQLNQIV